ncbi:MAG: hypothetical protein CMJ64_20880 [Planctomycetaceae bacterium]|nr:hypothetical protein [Planctomycetaceae bacterium]
MQERGLARCEIKRGILATAGGTVPVLFSCDTRRLRQARYTALSTEYSVPGTPLQNSAEPCTVSITAEAIVRASAKALAHGNH